MSSQKFYGAVKQVFSSNFASRSNEETANLISKALIGCTSKSLHISPALVSNLNSRITHLVLSNPRIPASSCLRFFNFLQSNQSIVPQKPDFEAHITLILRLFGVRRFAEAKKILNAAVVGENIRRPVSELASVVGGNSVEPKIKTKFFDMLFRVYGDNRKFEEGLEVFEYMVKNEFVIDERSCMVYLVAFRKSNQFESLYRFFQRMVECNVVITVYSMTLVIDGLCKRKEVEKARILMDDLVSRGVKPNVYTFNTLINAYVKKSDCRGVEEILAAVQKAGVEFNAATYTLLIEWRARHGNIEDAEKLFERMHEKGVVADIHAYTSMISLFSKLGDVKKAFALFDELVEKGLEPNVHTYGSLVYGVCKAGNMDAAEMLLNEMQSKGIDMNRVVFNTVMDGYCKQGMIDEAWRLQGVMARKGLKADVYVYNIIANGLCKLKRHEEAKRLLFAMVDKGVALNTVAYTTLIDIYSKEGLSKEGRSDEAFKLYEEMKEAGFTPDDSVYSSLVGSLHGASDVRASGVCWKHAGSLKEYQGKAPCVVRCILPFKHMMIKDILESTMVRTMGIGEGKKSDMQQLSTECKV
ncbi:UNVERIFIED_CONTAM: Pentatricopeptide repeat-containing protein [Sesamum calycinum]|uniref:Pentatricopeptide repeat-containing protein n=1 Tax=Sesamum calycinum TaxID=2727403 RepID=A0AAW2NUX6_9LAMI